MIAPIVSIRKSGHHRRLCVNASLKVSGPNVRDAKPARMPDRKMSNELTKSAEMVCAKKRAEPATTASDIPIQGVINGATSMPKMSRAWEFMK